MVCVVGVDLINDIWGGVDLVMFEVVVEFGVGLVCVYIGGVLLCM